MTTGSSAGNHAGTNNLISMVRILIIEDSADERQALADLLAGAGHRVYCAPNGKVALQLLRERRVELVITDMLMPEMEGVETIVALRRDHPEVKIIAVSGGGAFVPDNCLDLARNLGAQRVLTKPFTLGEILDSIQAALGKS
jgi:CheY-like chemotaxis protein